MSLEEKINTDIKSAMLAKEKEKLEALRAIKSAILLAKTEKQGLEELPQEAEVKLLQKLVKQRRESAEIYKSQNRTDLYETESFQASVIEQYLPAQLSEQEINDIVVGLIKQIGATSIKDMGKIMGLAASKLAGKADNKTISEIIKKHFAG
ncbi:MAG: GatB/YqeY domain-containing protein [Bacteroidota bacterium]|nr:GatB/YqeY domain-containing protein [Bacteroidota bacterium]